MVCEALTCFGSSQAPATGSGFRLRTPSQPGILTSIPEFGSFGPTCASSLQTSRFAA